MTFAFTWSGWWRQWRGRRLRSKRQWWLLWSHCSDFFKFMQWYMNEIVWNCIILNEHILKFTGRHFASEIYILCSPCNMEQNRLRSSLKNLFSLVLVLVLVKGDEELRLIRTRKLLALSGAFYVIMRQYRSSVHTQATFPNFHSVALKSSLSSHNKQTDKINNSMEQLSFEGAYLPP